MKNGDIWLVDLSDAKGHEQRGVRPGLSIIISEQIKYWEQRNDGCCVT
jgi:mRNA-degrading endonuclease toxin of MazEF toxin-antitoxin module